MKSLGRLVLVGAASLAFAVPVAAFAQAAGGNPYHPPVDNHPPVNNHPDPNHPPVDPHHPRGAPAPIAGAGIGALLLMSAGYRAYRRKRDQA